jgi:hypothetical protein
MTAKPLDQRSYNGRLALAGSERRLEIAFAAAGKNLCGNVENGEFAPTSW